jgi:predicted anti-sigma-YlaC factor YlaD
MKFGCNCLPTFIRRKFKLMSASLFPSRQHAALKILTRFRGEIASAGLHLNALTRGACSTEIASAMNAFALVATRSRIF